jgi:hypothetical protein
MTERNPDDVTLSTLHEDLTAGFADGKAEMRAGFADVKAEMRSGFADLKTTLITGFRGLATRESSEEMVRLLREANRINEARFTGLDVRIREQHFETQQVLHALVEGQRRLTDGLRGLGESHRSLSADIKALIARIDAMIRRRDNGEPAA